MEVLGYIGYAALLYFAVTWTIGVRVKLDAGVPTIFGALFFFVGAVVIPTFGLNTLHSFWVIVAGFLVTVIIAPISVSIPILSAPFRILASIFAGIVRVGIPSTKIQAAQDAGMRLAIEEWARKNSTSE